MKKIFKWAGIVIGILLVLGLSLLGYSSLKTNKALAAVFPDTPINIDKAVAEADVKIGERIVRIRNGCIDCHGEDLGGKLVMDDPALGHIYAKNLTPFKLKEWSNNEIAAAIRYGLNRQHKPLIFMPAEEYNKLSETDLASVIAYLRSLPPVERENEEIIVGPLAKILFSLGKLPMLASSHSIDFGLPFYEKPEESPTKEFGSYLAKTGCIGCHGTGFTGGPIPGAPPEWPPAADIRLSKNKVWTEESFVTAMRKGISPVSSQAIRPPMPIPLTSQMSDTEIKALWLFLSSVE